VTHPPLAPNARLRWDVVDRLLRQLAPRRVLEVGCGMGGFGSRMAARSGYVGLEPDPVSYRAAAAALSGAGGRVVNGGIEALTPGESFDLVCAFEVVEHLEDDRGAVASWLERLAPGGAVMLSVPAGPERFGAWDDKVGHLRRYTPAALGELLVGAGCHRAGCVYYGWPLGLVTETARNFLAGRRSEPGGGAPVAERTAASGRVLQPGAAAGAAVALGTVPFALAQRLRPGAGTGLVAVGLLPGAAGGLPAGVMPISVSGGR
jgi:SAM-dependent methyltransferase